MAQNPYAGFNASADPYTQSSDSLAAATPNPPRERSPGATPSTDDYDPYGDRYGTPPLGTPPPQQAANREQQRRAPRPPPGRGRTGGYGGFYAQSIAPAGSAGPSPKQPLPVPRAPQQQQQQVYGGRDNRSRENLPAPRSRRRRTTSDESRGFRNGASDGGSMRPPDGPAAREFRKPK
ncbi:hypothetical protein VE04_05347 [Pseudogymnoascus sp. 24MN13]|nr:hypothetical protein VE04_05347 [Pseudogymnoascus sp. 24MN13]